MSARRIVCLSALLVMFWTATSRAQTSDGTTRDFISPASLAQAQGGSQLADAWMSYHVDQERQSARTLRYYGFGLQLAIAIGWAGASVPGIVRHASPLPNAFPIAGSAVALGIAGVELFTTDPQDTQRLLGWGLAVQGLAATTAFSIAALDDGCSGDCARSLTAVAVGTGAFTLAALAVLALEPPRALSRAYETYQRTSAAERTALARQLLDERYDRARRAERVFLAAGTVLFGALAVVAVTGEETGTQYVSGIHALLTAGALAIFGVAHIREPRPSVEIDRGSLPTLSE